MRWRMASWVVVLFGVVAALGLDFYYGGVTPSSTRDGLSFEFKELGTGRPYRLDEEFPGKALLIVNTASYCGFTPQFEGLERLYQRYKDRGFVVLGVPSNDFGNQEPGTSEEIEHFCRVNKFSTTFPMTEKEVVCGSNAHPFFQYVQSDRGLGWIAQPRWNFWKILISPDGHLVNWFSSLTSPESQRVIDAIEKALPKETTI